MSDLADPRFLDDRIAHWAETTPDDEAITYFERSWTWAQWNDRVRRLAGALKERGVTRGDVVASLDKNHPACVELTLAAASLGAANAIINFRLAAEELDYVLNDSGAKVLIVGKELRENVDKIRDKLTHVENVIEVTPEGEDGDEYEAMLAAATPVERGDRCRARRCRDHHVLVGHHRPTQGRRSSRRPTSSPTPSTRTRASSSTTATRTWCRCRCSTSVGRPTCSSAFTTAFPA